MELDDDPILVRRMLSGDQRAFDEFFHGYFDRLYRFALVRVGGDADAAEEMVQQTLCRAVEKLELYRGEAALFTWLCQICRNAVADHYRSKEHRAEQIVPFEDTAEIRAALESLSALPALDPQVSMQDEQLRRVVRVILDYLPKRYADVLEWKYVQGLSVKEIAARLGLGPKAAESVLSRARAAFRDGLAAFANEDALAAFTGTGSTVRRQP
ncbi:MAG TPA: sigma-70 family RNA polymerase sigma factor [Gammaproteobacteria bacterium]|nr:sigma-70 family RNA polymerase sigma factor [Gammaproteobacteria bacterium]